MVLRTPGRSYSTGECLLFMLFIYVTLGECSISHNWLDFDAGLSLDNRKISLAPLTSRFKRGNDDRESRRKTSTTARASTSIPTTETPTTNIPSTKSSDEKKDTRHRGTIKNGQHKNASTTTTTSTTTIQPRTTSVSPAASSTTLDPSTGLKEKTSSFVHSEVQFEARDVSYFLESHPAHSVHDPRAYFTEERSSRSLAIMLRELRQLPRKVRFAFMVRVFNELGRKTTSKLNYYATEVFAILSKTPDDLGNKPEASMLVDAIDNAFESKLDMSSQSNPAPSHESPIKKILLADPDKYAIFNASQDELSKRFAKTMAYFVLKPLNEGLVTIEASQLDAVVKLLGSAMIVGSVSFEKELAKNDKFSIPGEVSEFSHLIFEKALKIFENFIKENDTSVLSSAEASFDIAGAESFLDLNPMSGETGLKGSWNTYLFSNLGSSERVIKLLASLLSRVPSEAKSSWLNAYNSQVDLELERSLSGFVMMQSMAHNKNASETYLLDPERVVKIMPVKRPEIRENYLNDKNRIPARCYLAGRRWRFVLTRGLKNFADMDTILNSLSERIGELKVKYSSQVGNDIYRLCLPRLEVGLLGWGINGNPKADGSDTSKFPLRNSIDGLSEVKDPFRGGVDLGYKIGFKIGYNEERNATLEMETTSNGFKKKRQQNKSANGSKEAKKSSDKGSPDLISKAQKEVDFLAMAAFRRATAVAGQKAFELAISEGYRASISVSIRAGIFIPSEAGSRMAALKCVSFAGQTGKAVGRATVEDFMVDKHLSEPMRASLIDLGEKHGLWAGQQIGYTIGSIVGKLAAEEAFKHSIIRGGRLEKAKFHKEEFEAGAKLAYEAGYAAGKRLASSSSLDPSAPHYFRLPLPVFSDADKADGEVDQWEKDLIKPISQQAILELHKKRGHITVSGLLKGSFNSTVETKVGLRRSSFITETKKLELSANGFISNNVTFLTLNGTINNFQSLRGSLISSNILSDEF